MAEADFQSLLDQPVTEVDRPKPQPIGTYVFNVADYEFGKSKQKQTDYVQFKLVPISAEEDVDQEELTEFLGDKSLSDKSFKQDYYLTKDAVWRLNEFLLDYLKIEPGVPLREMIEMAKGMQVRGVIGHSPSQRDANIVYANITQFAPVD